MFSLVDVNSTDCYFVFSTNKINSSYSSSFTISKHSFPCRDLYVSGRLSMNIYFLSLSCHLPSEEAS